MNKTFLKEVLNKLAKSKSDLNYYKKTIGAAVQTKLGIVLIKKPYSLTTRFCVSFDEHQEGSIESSNESATNMRSKATFVEENMQEFDRKYNIKNCCNLYHSFKLAGFHDTYYSEKANEKVYDVVVARTHDPEDNAKVEDFDEEDLAKVNEAITFVRNEHAKRIESYWKKYGATKISVHTYSVWD